MVTKGGRVQEYREAAAVMEVATKIRQAAREECEIQQRRTVCAYLEGVLVDIAQLPQGEWRMTSFDPRREGEFMTVDGEGNRRPWNRAEAARFDDDGKAWVLNAEWRVDPR